MSINLLPWRDIKRQKQHRNKIARLLITLLGSSLCIVALNYFLKNELDHLTLLLPPKNTISQLKIKLAAYHKEIHSLRLLKENQQLIKTSHQEIQNLTACLLTIANALPNQTVLTQINIDQQDLLILGSTNNTSDIETYMQRLSKNGIGKKPQLADLEANNTNNSMHFKIQTASSCLQIVH